MNTRSALKMIFASFIVFSCGTTFAQDTSEDEANVWAVVEDVWDAEAKGDRDWPDRFLADDFSGWSGTAPVPRNKSSVKMWDRFGEQLGKMVAHELYPYAIVVHDDVAIAHYLYSNAYKNKDGKIDMNNGRYTDVLVRTDEGWKLLAWHGGDDDKD